MPVGAMQEREKKGPRGLYYCQFLFVSSCTTGVWVFVSLAPGPVYTTVEDGGWASAHKANFHP